MEGTRASLSDAAVAADLRLVTPRLGFGRLVFDAGALNRYRNYLNRQSFLGGDGRLRGFPSSSFRGKDLIVYNLEFRTRPLELFSCQLGGAAFFDVGHAANGFDQLNMRQSAGLGIRILFPQLDRVVFRGDIGFPLSGRVEPSVSSVPLAPFTIAIAFEQAFSLPGVGGRVGSATGTGYLGQ
jgi:Omp85 superfamily domain